MKTIQTLLLLLFLVLSEAFSTVRLTDNPNDVVKREVKERTCPACVTGNFTQNSWILSESQLYQDKGFPQYKDCELNPIMVQCSGACVTIMIHQKAASANLYEYEYDSLMMGCSDNIKVGNNWPQDKGNPHNVSSWLMFDINHKDFKIISLFHTIQYNTREIFDHVQMFGYHQVWPTGITTTTTTTTPKTPNSYEKFFTGPTHVIVLLLLFFLIIVINLQNICWTWMIKKKGTSKKWYVEQMEKGIELTKFSPKQAEKSEDNGNKSHQVSNDKDDGNETIQSNNDAEKDNETVTVTATITPFLKL